MKSRRRRISELGAALLGVAIVGFVGLYFVYVPFSHGGASGLVGVLMIPDMIAGTIGLWLLIWAGLFWMGGGNSEKRTDPEYDMGHTPGGSRRQ